METNHTDRFQTTAKHAEIDSQPRQRLPLSSATHRNGPYATDGLRTWPAESIRGAAVLVVLLASLQIWRGLAQEGSPDRQPICHDPVQVEPGKLLVCAGNPGEALAGFSQCCNDIYDLLEPGDTIACRQETNRCRSIRGRMPPDMLALLKVPIDPNEATERDLTSLPGIGTTLARNIVEYRREHGPFPTIRSLLAVSGIGRQTLERMRPRLRLSH